MNMTPRQRKLVESAQRQLGANRHSEVQAKKAVEPEREALEGVYHCSKCGKRVKRGNRDGEAIAWCSVCEPHFNREKFLPKVARLAKSLEAGLVRKRRGST